ncbi:MAG: FkbM family methyltransferase [Chloroflexota bacterium]|nr:FkbM family methyltransferase [Gloeomargarita sp. SKYB31]MDW8119884.1 FkbM family methyltransferase [Chloroflexota bacterium]
MWSLGYDIRRITARDPWLAVKNFLEPAKVHTIFDVGAFVGDFTARFLSQFPQAQIYAFEPSPSQYQKLEQRFRGHPRVHTFPIAISDQEGMGRFFLNSNPATNSLLSFSNHAAYPGQFSTNATLSVPITTLDLFCRKHNISTIDILKVDVQGADMLVLKGAENLLRTANIAFVYVELLFVPVYTPHYDGLSVLSYLEQFGYSLLNFYDFGIAPDGRIHQCDALLIHRKVL